MRSVRVENVPQQGAFLGGVVTANFMLYLLAHHCCGCRIFCATFDESDDAFDKRKDAAEDKEADVYAYGVAQCGAKAQVGHVDKEVWIPAGLCAAGKGENRPYDGDSQCHDDGADVKDGASISVKKPEDKDGDRHDGVLNGAGELP